MELLGQQVQEMRSSMTDLELLGRVLLYVDRVVVVSQLFEVESVVHDLFEALDLVEKE